jgi:hypothetical protein
MSAPDLTTRLYASLKHLPIGPVNPEAIQEFVAILQTLFLSTLYGTTTNDDADPGQIGEVIDSGNVSGIAIPTGTATNVASINLTAGDWEVYGYVGLLLAAATSVNAIIGSSSPVSATLGNESFVHFTAALVPGAGNAWQYAIPTVRYSLAAPATIWLVELVAYTSTAPTARGRISARRMR